MVAYPPKSISLIQVLPRSAIVKLVMDVLQMGNKLGDGASGEVFAATLEGQAVAVKVRMRCATLQPPEVPTGLNAFAGPHASQCKSRPPLNLPLVRMTDMRSGSLTAA